MIQPNVNLKPTWYVVSLKQLLFQPAYETNCVDIFNPSTFFRPQSRKLVNDDTGKNVDEDNCE